MADAAASQVPGAGPGGARGQRHPAYAAAARDRGVTICTRTPVTGVELRDGAVRTVRTAAGTIRTQWVVVATGAWTRQFCQHLGLNVRAVPVRHQAFVTAPLSVVSATQPVVR